MILAIKTNKKILFILVLSFGLMDEIVIFIITLNVVL